MLGTSFVLWLGCSLTDDRLGVVTGYIVPLDSIIVEAVEDGKAVLVSVLPVVRLWYSISGGGEIDR